LYWLKKIFWVNFIFLMFNKKKNIEVKLDEYKEEVVEVQIIPTARQVKSLSDIMEFCTGEDHLAALDKQGRVFTMGDDTYGKAKRFK
jgi:alpha-tubulin suppressor-like RCC1 family protein